MTDAKPTGDVRLYIRLLRDARSKLPHIFGIPDAPHDDIIRAARLASADEFISRLPDGYASIVGERGMTLSGGERQRISLARAFLKDAPILILDEPTSAVDIRTETQIVDAIERLMANRTTFMIAHRTSTLAACDMMISVDDGVVAAEGPAGRPQALPRVFGIRRRSVLHGVRGPVSRSGERSHATGVQQADPSRMPTIDSLRNGLSIALASHVASDVRIMTMDRLPWPQASTFPSEEIRCVMSDGRRMRLYCKYSGGYQGDPFGHKRGVAYEAIIYQDLLASLTVSTAKAYGSYADDCGDTWLILEFLDDAQKLTTVADIPIAAAARWIGDFHRRGKSFLVDPRASRMIRYNAAYYAGWARQTSAFAGNLHDQHPWLATLCDRFEGAARNLAGGDQTTIHGEYYAQNVLTRGGLIHPVDWESAAIGPGEIDLASLTEGWPPEVTRECEGEYAHARWPLGAPSDFARVLDYSRVYWQLRWLGNRPQWTHGMMKGRFTQLRSLGEKLQLL